MMPSLDFMRFMNLLFLLMLSALVLSYSQDGFAADTPVAQVIWTKGSVEAMQPGGIARQLQRGSPLYEHDQVVTGGGGSGEIAFTDSGVVSLSAGTQFSIDQYHYDKGASGGKSVFSIIKGGFRTITGAIPKQNPDAYQFNTPVATIGVRGTIYSGFYSSSGGLVLHIEQGSIEAANSHGKVVLAPCQQAVSNSCVTYARVLNTETAPQSLSQRPPEFNRIPQVEPVSHQIINNIINIPPGGPGGPSNPNGTGPNNPNQNDVNPNGPSKTVSNFCVGLLKSMYSRMFG